MPIKRKTVILDHTGFSVQYWGRYSLEDFITLNVQQGAYKSKNLEDRKQLLTIVYDLIKQHDVTRTI